MGKTMSSLLYRFTTMARGENVAAHLRALNESQWWPVERHREEQLVRLRALLRHACDTVPAHRRRMEAAGLVPEQVTSADDLRALPIMTKEEIREDWEQFRSTAHHKGVTVDSTSGSTGHPLRFAKTADSYAAFRAAQWRGFAWYGIEQGDPSLRLMGTAVDPLSRAREMAKDYIQNRTRMWAYDLTGERLAAECRRFDAFRPAYAYGYPSLLYPIADHALRHPEHTFARGMKAVISTSESLYPHRRRVMEEAYRCPVVNEYGARELGIIAFECPQGGLHLTAEHFVVEIVRGDRPARPGEQGEVVITDLTNPVMPFIRYKLGDIAALSEERCPCGRGLPLLTGLEGAVFGILRTPDGSIVSGIILYYLAEELILKHRSAMTQLRFVQRDLRSLDVLVARGAAFNEGTLRIVEQRLREYLGDKLTFNYQVVDHIPPLLSGKLRVLDSHVPLWKDGVD